MEIEDQDDGAGGEDNLAVEKEAREMGWTPKEKFKGNPDKWVTAEEFVERQCHAVKIRGQRNQEPSGRRRRRAVAKIHVRDRLLIGDEPAQLQPLGLPGGAVIDELMRLPQNLQCID